MDSFILMSSKKREEKNWLKKAEIVEIIWNLRNFNDD